MTPAAPAVATIAWTDAGQARTARWRSERGAVAPARVVRADDSTPADTAYHLACAGTALLWQGDFHNAQQLLQAMARRIDKSPARKQRKGLAGSGKPALAPQDAFNRHRLAQSQRARVLGMLLLPVEADYRIGLRRAPDTRPACTHAWGPAAADGGASVVSLRDLLGMTGAYQWHLKGVEIAALGAPPNNRIHPCYGVFSPVRGEYVALVASAPWPQAITDPAGARAFDIGTGTGVLSAVLARRGIGHLSATDQDPRAVACARENLARLGLDAQVTVLQADLFPPGQADLMVCNPPWLPARPSAPMEGAVYDEGSRMLLGFLGGVRAHLSAGGQAWLILSDLAEHLGLRSRAQLLTAFATNGLQVLGRHDARPEHRKVSDASDPLHAARAAEVTSLWRLGVKAD